MKNWHPPECLFYKTKSGCRFGEKCSCVHRKVDGQPNKRSKNNDDKSAVAMLNKHELYDRTVRPVGNPLFAVTHVTSEGTDLLCATHQKHGNCLSVCRRRRCPIERSDPLEIDRGDPVSTETQKHRSGLCSTSEFQDAESVRSGNSHVTSEPVSFPPHPIPGGMLRHSFLTPSRREGPPSIWDTHGISGNVFANPDAS